MTATILITGANRGVGLALAQAAAARGCAVIATARAPADAEALERLRAKGSDVSVHPLDVTEPDSAAALAKALAGASIDVLVCNAGVLEGRGGLDDPSYSRDAFARVLMTNVAGPFFTVRALLPLLRRPGGKVAVISSLMGSSARAKGGSYLYRASKAAATNLAVNLAVELRPSGVAVGAYHPGWVRTDMGGGDADISAQESAEGLLGRFEALTPATTGVVEDYRGERIAF